MSTEKTETVELTLEESGSLCFLILDALRQLPQPPKQGGSIGDYANRSFIESLKSSHQKVSDANDKLMGKT